MKRIFNYKLPNLGQLPICFYKIALPVGSIFLRLNNEEWVDILYDPSVSDYEERNLLLVVNRYDITQSNLRYISSYNRFHLFEILGEEPLETKEEPAIIIDPIT